MTPQELLEKDGFLLFGTFEAKLPGDIVWVNNRNMVADCKLVVVGPIDEAEAQRIAHRNKKIMPKARFYYRVIAE